MGYLLLLLLGMCTGLRTMTPIAVLCWFSYVHGNWARWNGGPPLVLEGWRHFAAYLPSVVIFTLMALGEYIGDKLPKTPSRIGAIGLTGRLLFGVAVAVILAPRVGLSPVLAGVAGAAGALMGAYGGWFARTKLAEAVGKDWPVANVEDWIAIAASILLMNVVAGS